jgi:thioredoxin reductase
MNRLVIVGAGPVGLHAALEAATNGFDVTVVECGEVGAAMRRWAHVKLFTPFSMASTSAGRAAASQMDALPLADDLLTGEDYVQLYLVPLASSQLLKGRIQCSTELVAVSRQAYGKSHAIGKPERAASPFRLLVQHSDGMQDVIECDVLLDCTGFTTRHRSIGVGGIPCPGEVSCLSAGDYEIASTDSQRRQTDHVVVVGSGYSAATSVCLLQQSCKQVTWITRGDRELPISPVENDSLPERRALTEQANQFTVDPDSNVHWKPGAQIEMIERDKSGYRLTLSVTGGERTVLVCDRIVANPGFRPDTRPFEELQVHRCYATDGPIKLAAHLLGETSSDCLSQTAPGTELLRNPEPNFYILGAASYGRDSRFLLKNGLEQVTQLFESILVSAEAIR